MSTQNALVTQPTQDLIALLSISQKEVAEAIGVSHETIRGWSYGRSDPSPENRALLVAFVREHLARLERAARALAELEGKG